MALARRTPNAPPRDSQILPRGIVEIGVRQTICESSFGTRGSRFARFGARSEGDSDASALSVEVSISRWRRKPLCEGGE